MFADTTAPLTSIASKAQASSPSEVPSMIFKAAALTAALACSSPAFADVFSNYVYGNVTGFSSTTAGIMIQIDGGITPTNCTGSPAGYLAINHLYPEMVSTTLSFVLANRTAMYVYTDPTSGTFCAVTQVVPKL